MDKGERAVLEYLAANPGGEMFRFIPNAKGVRPSGRNGAHERRLIGLRDRGLVEGADGGVWCITAAGLDALKR